MQTTDRKFLTEKDAKQAASVWHGWQEVTAEDIVCMLPLSDQALLYLPQTTKHSNITKMESHFLTVNVTVNNINICSLYGSHCMIYGLEYELMQISPTPNSLKLLFPFHVASQ